MELSTSQSEWDYFDATQSYQGTVTDLHKKVSLLRQVFPNDEVEVEIEFESFSMLQKFQKKLQIEHQVFSNQQRLEDKNDSYYLWKQIYKRSVSKKPQDFRKLKRIIIPFKSSIQETVFYLQYEGRIKGMEAQYNYYIVPGKRSFSVYLKNPYETQISSFFINELFEMKNNLKICVQTNHEIFQKVKYSEFAVGKLEKLGIKTMIDNRYESAVFYSDKFANYYLIQKQISKSLAYHISVIKFPQNYIDSYILQEIFKLVYSEIKPVLASIERSYDMPVQIDPEKAAFVITDFHQIFDDGVQTIKQSLSKLKILEVQCQFLIQLRGILQKPQYSSLVRFNYMYRKCFILFSDSALESHSKIIEKFCWEVATSFKKKYKLIVHLVHMYQDSDKLNSEAQRILRISSYYKLNVVTFNSFSRHKDFNKIIIEPAQLGAYAEQYRQKQIKCFLYDFLTNKEPPQQLFQYSILEDQKLTDSYFCQQTKLETQNSFNFGFKPEFQTKMPDIQKQNERVSNEKQIKKNSSLSNGSVKQWEFISLNIPFEYPDKQDFDGNVPTIRGKRQRKIQTLMEIRWRRRLKIWKVTLNIKAKIVKLKSNDRIELVVGNLFILKNQYYRLKKFSEVVTKEVNEFKEGERGFISFVDLQTNEFVPCYQIQFVD